MQPPAWAFQQRALLTAMNAAIDPFLEKYTAADGSLIWKDQQTTILTNRDGADDFYESFYNWPLLYLLGGDDRLLALSHRHWEAVTRQLTAYGLVHDEFEVGYDAFHQSEGSLFLYFLALADPTHPDLRRRIEKFAGLYLGDDPHGNYDAERKLIRAPHHGSGGPRGDLFAADPGYAWAPSMKIYGLPLPGVPGIETFDDLKDPELARRMGQVINERMGNGDVPVNLTVTSLMTTAYLMTGDDRYRDWIGEYVAAWIGRAEANGGLLPDNIGLSGEIGEYHDGNWYGGHYGWFWPHGFYNIAAAAVVAAANARLVTGDAAVLDLPRTQFDRIMLLGEMRDPTTLQMSLGHHWIGATATLAEGQELFVVPFRYGPDGWFDYQPLQPVYALGIWAISNDAADWQRVEHLREASGYDWHRVMGFHNKEDAGHEEPWTRYLHGEFTGYPEQMLAASYGQVLRRSELIRADTDDLAEVHIHHWQQLNPVTTEALVQLTLGVPQHLYYGGLLHARVRYFDAERQRAGLPEDVAALVTGEDLAEPVIRLVNLSPLHERHLLVQAGMFGEHRFDTVSWQERQGSYPGDRKSYAAPLLETTSRRVTPESNVIEILLPPGTEITLYASMTRYVYTPTALAPWQTQGDSR